MTKALPPEVKNESKTRSLNLMTSAGDLPWIIFCLALTSFLMQDLKIVIAAPCLKLKAEWMRPEMWLGNKPWKFSSWTVLVMWI